MFPNFRWRANTMNIPLYVAHKGLLFGVAHIEGLRFAAHPRYVVSPQGAIAPASSRRVLLNNVQLKAAPTTLADSNVLRKKVINVK
jgi:hypothetical protein